MRLLQVFSTGIGLWLGLSGVSGAQAAVDTNASVVQMRVDCTENGATLNNCFTDITALTNWVFSTRNPAPSAVSPVLVKIGPGTFEGSFQCEDSGYVTLQGSGMQNTIINNVGSYPVALTNCKNMTFMNMTIKAGGLGIQGGGSVTFWHDVEIDVSGFYAWFDQAANSCYGPAGKHYWFNSRIVGRGDNNAVAYQSSCDESWFFGTEITKMTSGGSGPVYAVKASSPAPTSKRRGENHIYGGVVRVISSSSTSAAKLIAVHAENKGIVHIHGTGIDAIGTGPNSIVALSSLTEGEIHANETAYNLSTGVGGIISRVSKDSTGHIHAPYLWETHSGVPFANKPGITFESVTGYDMSVVTTTSGGIPDHPHIVIYDSSCPSKWFDSTINQCR